MGDLEDDLQVDLTPLIDVIFMLVIFFIMTTSFTLPVLDFDLPQSSTAQTLSRDHALRISVSEDGIYKIERDVVAKEQLADIIKAKAEQNPDLELSLELVIDKATPTEHLIYVADLARLYTKGRLLIVSEKSEELIASQPSQEP